jgi:hypothetical protein
MRVPVDPPLRPATLEEEAAIEALMKASIRHFFPAYYDAPQVEASLLYVACRTAN